MKSSIWYYQDQSGIQQSTSFKLVFPNNHFSQNFLVMKRYLCKLKLRFLELFIRLGRWISCFLTKRFFIKISNLYSLYSYDVCIITLAFIIPKYLLLKYFCRCYQKKYFSEHFSEACFRIVIISSCIENAVVEKYFCYLSYWKEGPFLKTSSSNRRCPFAGGCLFYRRFFSEWGA